MNSLDLEREKISAENEGESPGLGIREDAVNEKRQAVGNRHLFKQPPDTGMAFPDYQLL